MTNPLPLVPGDPSNDPVPGRHGSRSRMTCEFRCGNACDKPVPNPTDHQEFADVAAGALARRALLKTGAAGLGALVLGTLPTSTVPASYLRGLGTDRSSGGRSGRKLGQVSFRSVAPNRRDRVVVPPGFRSDVLIRWGDPVLSDAPDFKVRKQTPAKARSQFGYNNDYVGVLPIGNGRALLVANHEYTDENLMFPKKVYSRNAIKRIAMASQGMSVVKIAKGKRTGSYKVAKLDNPYNRRLHTDSPFALDGPAAGATRLQTSADPSGRSVRGTLANCSGGITPWGTVLSGEENFDQYFDASGDLDERYEQSYARYGITGKGTRGWSSVDPRFDLTSEPREPLRFGWVVEVDPFDRESTPRKHTMLGRFKHESATVALSGSGHAVVYMGDDERGEYIYRFVSAGTFDPATTEAARRSNLNLLSSGTLCVARFLGEGDKDGVHDGTGRWIPLTSDSTSYVEGMSVTDVLIDTRLAADKVAPTRMDRPEDIEPNPVNGRVYCALTNNRDRGTKFDTDDVNPLASSRIRTSLDAPLRKVPGNRNGYVLEMTPADGDHATDTFAWDLMLVCGDPDARETYFAGFPKRKVSPISCPDNVAFDAEGNLWIATNGNALGSNDGFFRVPTAGKSRGHVKQFLTVPIGAEVCGPFISKDQRTAFIAVQHPGETDGATFESPSSTWPHTNRFPRPAVITAYRS